MTVPTKLAAFGVAVAAAFALGYGVGEIAGPFEDEPTETRTHDSHWLEEK